ncbi:MAG TPA: acetyl-CoA carboxylase biotin carboxyl carrier protein subunit [Bacteroidales bacterium]|nr:acetyl-CoA carboxylase biotin carboxyl carrier protein subunit [Bacteroidales bacterium]
MIHTDEKKSDGEPGRGKIKYRTLILHGEKYRTLFTDKFKKRKKWQRPDDRKIMSVLPGTVVKTFAEAGDIVTEGETMLILEAMKMQNTYYYPHSGRIKKINVKVGDRIPKGFVMLEYE